MLLIKQTFDQPEREAFESKMVLILLKRWDAVFVTGGRFSTICISVYKQTIHCGLATPL